MPLDVVIGLGANLGDRLATLRSARDALSAIGRVTARSSVYETPPVGGPPQPPYLNAAMRLLFEGTPEELLVSLQAIERAHGRDRAREGRWGARPLDLDVLYIDGVRLDGERLTVPHPRLRERAFALAPLLEVMPDAPFEAPRDPTIRRVEPHL